MLFVFPYESMGLGNLRACWDGMALEISHGAPEWYRTVKETAIRWKRYGTVKGFRPANGTFRPPCLLLRSMGNAYMLDGFRESLIVRSFDI